MKSLICLKFSAVFFLIFMTSSVLAAGDDIPRIAIDELKKMIDSHSDIVILDTQLKIIYDKGHIAGAISFPWKKEITAADTKALPRNKTIILYCDCGPGEGDSSDMAAKLLQIGFSDVRVLKDPSIKGWKKAGYPLE